ncbi:hypothetical protein C8F04DRAFT_1203941 [Mycena alexandri]|uniref:Uncharacterized protein n=1 Tax=Mycena alexandri TaxID=1745969 RepID=A0AAD6WKV2_9AGAR|nr:hypothetical protein C8F04DRAFT_1203941 [Mycena alexandri]
MAWRAAAAVLGSGPFFLRTPNSNAVFGSGISRTPNLNLRSGSVRRSNVFERDQNSGISGVQKTRSEEHIEAISVHLPCQEIIWTCYMSSKWATSTIKIQHSNAATLLEPQGEKLTIRFGVRFEFDVGLDGANTEPERSVRFSHLPNLNAERASSSGSVQGSESRRVNHYTIRSTLRLTFVARYNSETWLLQAKYNGSGILKSQWTVEPLLGICAASAGSEQRYIPGLP